MKKTGKLLITAFILAGLFMFSSCNKEDVAPEAENPRTTVSDYLKMASSFSMSIEEEVTSGDDDGLKSAEVFDCLNVTIHENENGEFWPRSWTLDYGTENCECFFGNMRRGKIHVTLSDWWRREGSLREITFDNYYFNDNKIEGTKTILNTGENENGHLTFTKKVMDAKVIYPDETEMSWESEKVSELIEGNETFLFADDVWAVTGGGSGVNLDGKNFTATITSPLIYKNRCFYPVSGVLEIAVDGEELKIIDYGDGECDYEATVTVGDQSETIEL
jgi:hypothetical protein